MDKNVNIKEVDLRKYAILSHVNQGEILFLVTVRRDHVDSLIKHLKTVKKLP